jgi:ureidoglycolate dehydrogenase (NAD+)
MKQVFVLSIFTVSHDELKELSIKKLEEAGVRSADAEIVADILLHANLRGVDSHGILRLEHYCRRIKAGGMNPRPEVKIKYRGTAAAVLDGDDGLGHFVAKKAMQCAIDLAKKVGIGVVGVNNSSHCGALSYYVNQAASEGMIGIAATNTDKMVVPYGGIEPFFGTNPFAFGFPTRKNKPVIIDMATSIIAMGKILQAKETGKTIPENCAVNERGECVIEPDEFVALLPFGGPKGYGISMAVDIFSGVLIGTAFGPHVNIMYDNLDKPRKLGHFIAAIDAGLFIEKETFLSSMDQLIDELHAVKPADGFSRVLVPGDPEYIMEDERLKNGIPIAEAIYRFLKNES